MLSQPDIIRSCFLSESETKDVKEKTSPAPTVPETYMRIGYPPTPSVPSVPSVPSASLEETFANPTVRPIVTRHFKVVLLGDARTGKSAFVHRHRTGDFLQEYRSTLGVDVNPVIFRTNRGMFSFNVWEVAGAYQDAAVCAEYLKEAHAVVIFFDVTNRQSLRSVDKYLMLFQSVCPDAALLVVGNKVDSRQRSLFMENINPALAEWNAVYHSVAYIEHSSKSNYNIEKVPLSVLRQCLDDPELRFTEQHPPLEHLRRWRQAER